MPTQPTPRPIPAADLAKVTGGIARPRIVISCPPLPRPKPPVM
jgi:hypothetical protein